MNYRIGSLEVYSVYPFYSQVVNYRIGSLEEKKLNFLNDEGVNYRIGSLEVLLEIEVLIL